MKDKIVVTIDNQHSTTQDCQDKYYEYLARIEQKCNNIQNYDCGGICKECGEINKTVISIKSECRKLNSSFVDVYGGNEVMIYCGKCGDKCKYVKNTFKCSEENEKLKLSTHKLCVGDNISKEERLSEPQELRSESQLETVISETKDPESGDPPEHKNHAVEKDSSRGNEIIHREQESAPTNISDKNQGKSPLSIVHQHSTTPVKVEDPQGSLSVTSNLANGELPTSENAQSTKKNSAELSTSGDTHTVTTLSESDTQSKIQDSKDNVQQVVKKHDYNVAKEISNVVTLFYNTFASTILRNISSPKSITKHIPNNDGVGKTADTNRASAHSEDDNSQSHAKQGSSLDKSADITKGRENSGSDDAISVEKFPLGTSQEGIRDQGNYGSGAH
ncbi:hypothetical protein PGO_002225 [Plasmodium gonderi]|uniref:Variable surface protein n=1 Tax=Plasmodium gonderi TaxID=77519 RepID=A0A1Y1JP02_PLAGO|nr:hypothetical protein PGO_002225 [Plasmodium gonderi]GAW84306.1 hypothetical protein PGO_002225 [Plasmodium gonderi]